MSKRSASYRAQRAENALHELELSVVTQADKRRIARIYDGLRALDDEQAALKEGIDDLCEEYTNPNAPSDDCYRLVMGLRRLTERKQ